MAETHLDHGSTDEPQSEYYDIVMFGKTGRGKSTLGNRLLQVKDRFDSEAIFSTFTDGMISAKDVFRGFCTSSDVSKDKAIHSITQKCELVANEKTKVRVLDAPGFSPTHRPEGVTVYQANLQIFRWVVREQLDPHNNMCVRRLLYFLPARGVPEKLDGELQEELELMYHYFGIDAFNHMVIIATQQERHQSVEFTNEDHSVTQTLVGEAIRCVTEGKVLTCCPPVVYISYKNKKVNENALSLIKGAAVLEDGVFVPKFRLDVCSRCGGQIRYGSNAPGDKPTPVGVTSGKRFTRYEKSRCHPYFVSKYNIMEKVVGGGGHLATLGIPYGVSKVFNKKIWPGFNNSDEICPVCDGNPGSEGCCPVLAKIKVKGKEVEINHTSQL